MINKLTFSEKAMSLAGAARIKAVQGNRKTTSRSMTRTKKNLLNPKPLNLSGTGLANDRSLDPLLANEMAKDVKSGKSKNYDQKTTLKIKDSTWYQFGSHTLSLVSSGIALATNIMAAREILNPKTDDEKFGNGNNSYSDYYQNYGSQNKREQSYAITANKMLPYLNFKASAALSSIRFGAPMFHY